MGALTTAFELTEGDWTKQFDRITVYQRGWRLGGKGASSRGPNGRIEEHGLHVLLGYYDHTFDVMRRCYEALDRDRSHPACPIRTWDDAVAPSNLIGVVDPAGGEWQPWVARFSPVAGRPGERAGGTDASAPPGMSQLVIRSLRLLVDFFASLPLSGAATGGAIELSASPTPRSSTASSAASMADVVRGAGLLGLTLPLTWAERAIRLAASRSGNRDLERTLPSIIEPLRHGLRAAMRTHTAARRSYQLIELVLTNMSGVLADGLLSHPDGYGAINDLDYREWLLRHGIDPLALETPILRGMYDLVFGFEEGDPTRPRFSAGLGLELATKMLLGYSGAPFWKMQAGMGEVIFAPLYQVLRDRGVEFRFFHRVDALRLAEDGRSIAAIDLGLQAESADGGDAYDPLIQVKDLPCWPNAPLTSQLRDGNAVEGVDTESFWSPRRDVGRRTLEVGTDFDTVVFAISLGMVPYLCDELMVASPAWRSMVDNVGVVATQAFQLWLSEDERRLGWSGPDGVTVSGFVTPFDTWASMPHLLPQENWAESDRPSTIAYFCSVLATPGTHDDNAPDVERESRAVRARAKTFLGRDVATLWPAAVENGEFRWELLCDGSSVTSATPGEERFDTQYWRANIDPSDLYVQSLPGTDKYRMQPGATGFTNLVVAGDWTDCGLNAGCVEAAALSGQLAARAVREQVANLSSVGDA
jgi:uncharacterized protein with NAD-binding domain and iron-sulfur cluster